MTKSQTSLGAKARHALKILSWNINHQRDKHEGTKFLIPDFKKTLELHDIVCLQETKGPVTLEGFKCYNSNRKGSSSGGVCIGIRKSISSGAKAVNTSTCEDMICIKIPANIFNLDRDLNLINIYNSPPQGAFKKRRAITNDDLPSTLELLSEFIATIPACEDILLVGDLNARTGTLSDTLSQSDIDDRAGGCDRALNGSIMAYDLPQRNNLDQTLNTNGKPFIELLQSHQLVILNGRTIGDLFGGHTCRVSVHFAG